MENINNDDLKQILGQLSFLQTLQSIITAEGKVVLTKKDSRRLEQIAQTVNSLKLFYHSKE
jgi:hypothetical protein